MSIGAIVDVIITKFVGVVSVAASRVRRAVRQLRMNKAGSNGSIH